MDPGKIASQAGHAYIGAFIASQATPEGKAYSDLSPGTKACLQGNLEELSRALEELQQAEIPHYLVVDSGCPDFFDGKPTITALGFGPSLRTPKLRKITKRLKLL
jgi:peptidyl-tRNA hydrolase